MKVAVGRYAYEEKYGYPYRIITTVNQLLQTTNTDASGEGSKFINDYLIELCNEFGGDARWELDMLYRRDQIIVLHFSDETTALMSRLSLDS